MSEVMARRSRRPVVSQAIPRGEGTRAGSPSRSRIDGPTMVMRSSGRPQRRRSTYLIVLHGMREGAVFEVTVGSCSIGRGRRADVCLQDDGISRLHAEVIRDPDGTVKVVDHGSTNGTFVNGRRVEAESLRDGDRIRIGPTTVLGLRYTHPAAGTGPCAQAMAAAEPAADPAPERGGAGTHDAAVEVYLQTLRLRERALGPEHLELVDVLEALGNALLERERFEEAARLLHRALRILEQHSSSSRVTLGRVHFCLGRCALGRGRATAAVEHLERAQSLLAQHEPGGALLPEAWFALARALQATGSARNRRMMLARRALDACQGNLGLRRLQSRIHRWIEQHSAS